MCYNIFTYKSPPMALGRLELPRQLASGCQDRHVCQFHHSAVENRGGCSCQDATRPNPLSFKNTPKYGCLSMGKTIIDAHKTIIGGYYDMP